MVDLVVLKINRGDKMQDQTISTLKTAATVAKISYIVIGSIIQFIGVLLFVAAYIGVLMVSPVAALIMLPIILLILLVAASK